MNSPIQSDAAELAAREFDLSERDFRRIVELIAGHAGIALSDAKRNLVYGRLVRRLKALDIVSFSAYIDLLDQPGNEELEHFVNSLTTNLTSFFRERHHFEFLAKELLPGIRENRRGEKIRAWSAGCSTGEEAYSMAITMAEHLPDNQEFRILATDLDSSVVAHAAAGIYPAERIASLSRGQTQRWFQRGTGSKSGMVRVRQDLRSHIVFRKLNLMDPWPMRRNFDFIFCRNVIIYFDKDAQRKLFKRFAEVIAPEGHMFIGHSESLFKVSDAFTSLGHTIYRKVE
mgnify:FL=1